MAAVMSSTPRSARGGMPFLPGFATSDAKSHNKRGHTLTYGPGGAMDTMRSGEVPVLDLSVLQQLADPHHRFNMSARSITHDEREAMRESARNTYQPSIPPAWLKHDRQVLRFYAFFQEPVHENPTENFRVRHCCIQFYLEDGTMMITEPKIENSGIPQGTFVKRHRIPKPREMGGGGYYTYQDLRVGMDISIYARAFRITDADDFTRAFYETALAEQLQHGEDPPMDSFRAAKLQESARLASPSSRDVIEGKEYNQLALGGNRRNAKLQQYLENDRKVLNFKCYWDDHTRYGARQYYILHYYLSDDTVEILESLARNSGRDPYPVFWRKGSLRKNPHVSPVPSMLEPEPVIYKPEDLMVGDSINAYGRDIVIYDCDEFTRDFYRQYMNHEQDKLEIKDPEPIHVQLSFPPHTGIGTEEDSLASCLSLTPRPPRRDINKLMTDAGKVVRFEGRIYNPTAEDKNRRFVIGIFLADDSVGVWEMKSRNSGHAAGKFALKGKKKNPATGTWFTAKDFFVGAFVEISATTFQLVQADQAALRYMEENNNEFVVADVNQVLAKLRPLAGALQNAFPSDVVPAEQLGGFAQAHGIDIVDHELLTLTRAFGDNAEAAAVGPLKLRNLLQTL